MILLGIESSCDETAAAVVEGEPGTPGNILSNIVFGQTGLHEKYGGVVPEIAARAHAERLDTTVVEALETAGHTLSAMDAIAVTAGPGLIGGVLSGVMTAKGLCWARGKPLVAVNHLAGHALTPRLTDALPYPYLMLLASGGHCQFLRVEAHDRFRRLGGTIDDAPGEAFDKIARLLGLGFPGGPAVEKRAKDGDPKRFELPRPLLDRPGCDLSFSGLKTATRRAMERLVDAQGGLYQQDVSDLCASFQAAIADVLVEKTRRAMALAECEAIAIAGGVAANGQLRVGLMDIAQTFGCKVITPPLNLCTDNAAMIAWAGLERFAEGGCDDLTLSARPRWPLDETASPLLGSGRKGAKS